MKFIVVLLSISSDEERDKADVKNMEKKHKEEFIKNSEFFSPAMS